MTDRPDLKKLAALRDSMLLQLEGQAMEGLEIDRLRDAMNRPGALESMGELMALDPKSVRQGEAAPDFELPYLPGYGRDGESLRPQDRPPGASRTRRRTDSCAPRSGSSGRCCAPLPRRAGSSAAGA